MEILAMLPTDKAMKELSRTGATIPAVRSVVENMALYKMDLIRSMKHMRLREDFCNKVMESKMTIADKEFEQWAKMNPDYKIEILEK